MIYDESSILNGSHRDDLIRLDESMIHRIRIFLKTGKGRESGGRLCFDCGYHFWRYEGKF